MPNSNYWLARVDCAVARLFARGGGARLPVDLIALCRAQGVQVVRSVPLLCEGSLRIAAGGYEISVKASTGAQPRDAHGLTYRQRFSVAHELAHALILELSPELSHQSPAKPGKQELEELCNYGAQHILVPGILLDQLAYRWPESYSAADALLKLTRAFEVSPEVMIRRANGSPGVPLGANRSLLVFRDRGTRSPLLVGIYHRLDSFREPRLYIGLMKWAKSWGIRAVEYRVLLGPNRQDVAQVVTKGIRIVCSVDRARKSLFFVDVLAPAVRGPGRGSERVGSEELDLVEGNSDTANWL